jgi:hypothetical protein
MIERSAREVFFPAEVDPFSAGLMRRDRVFEEESVVSFGGCFVDPATFAAFSRADFSAHAFLLAADFSARVSFFDDTGIKGLAVRDREDFPGPDCLLVDVRAVLLREVDRLFLVADLLADLDESPNLNMSKIPMVNLLTWCNSVTCLQQTCVAPTFEGCHHQPNAWTSNGYTTRTSSTSTISMSSLPQEAGLAILQASIVQRMPGLDFTGFATAVKVTQRPARWVDSTADQRRPHAYVQTYYPCRSRAQRRRAAHVLSCRNS